MARSSGTASCDISPRSDESACVVCSKESYSYFTCGLRRAKSGKKCTFCKHVVCSNKGCSTKGKHPKGRQSSDRSCSYCRDFLLSPLNDGEKMVEGIFDKREGRHNEITSTFMVCMKRDTAIPEATVYWQMQAAQTENYPNSLEEYGNFLLISNVDSILFTKHTGTSKEEKFSVTFKLSGDDGRIVSYIFETQDEELFQGWQRALKAAYHVIKRRHADSTTPLIQGSSADGGHDIQ